MVTITQTPRNLNKLTIRILRLLVIGMGLFPFSLLTDILNLLKLPQQPAKAVRNLIGKLCPLT